MNGIVGAILSIFDGVRLPLRSEQSPSNHLNTHRKFIGGLNGSFTEQSNNHRQNPAE